MLLWSAPYLGWQVRKHGANKRRTKDKGQNSASFHKEEMAYR